MDYFHELFDNCVQCNPEKVFLHTKESALSYADVDRRVNNVLSDLRRLEIQPGSRIFVVGENCADYIAAILAVSKINGVFFGFNARQTAFELEKYVFEFSPHLIIFVESESADSKNLAKYFNAANGTVPGISLLTRTSTKSLLPSSIAAVIFSSGTTGEPKGIMVSHQGMLLGAQNTVATRGMVATDRLYACVPMTHSFGLSSILCATLMVGAGIILRSKFDPQDAIDCIEHHGLTALQGPPTMYTKIIDWVQQANIEKISSPDLRYLYTGTAPLNLVLKQTVEQLLGKPLNYGYASSEYPTSITVTKISEPRQDLSTGPAGQNIEIKILVDNQPAPTGQIGNIIIRGPALTPGYLDNPELTRTVIDAQGWFNTGDLGYLDADNNLFVVAREKEVIKRSGFSVFPAEIENLLNSLPEIDSAAVIGKPDINGHEQILAFVKIKTGFEFDEKKLKSYLRSRLAPYKQPNTIRPVVEFPLTVSSKIIKRKILNDPVCQR